MATMMIITRGNLLRARASSHVSAMQCPLCLKFEGFTLSRAAPTSVLCQAASVGAIRMSDRRELYRSPNGDSWFLGREPANGHAFVIHQPNAPSGGRLSHIEIGEFLRQGAGPEQQALLRLIGTLVEVSPDAHRS